MAKGEIAQSEDEGEPMVAAPLTKRTSAYQAKSSSRRSASAAARGPKPLMNPSALKITRKKRKAY